MFGRELPYTGCQLESWIAAGKLKPGVHFWDKDGVRIYDPKAIDDTISALRRVNDRVPSFYEHQVEPPTVEDFQLLKLIQKRGASVYLAEIDTDRLSVFAIRRLFQAGYVNLRMVGKKLLVEVVNG